ncbi:hypothetical protein [Kitasatospora sp. NPDC089509]|uniref:hypothetical protein n=1 Tax=Kitasatospora sp. NPDC089509 TaxID=3364079 RepID=UPI0037F9CABB
MRIKAFSVALTAAMAIGASAPLAYGVDVIQEHNSINCRFGDGEGEKQKYCDALANKPMSEVAKNCLVKAGIGGAVALVIGRVNATEARKLAITVVATGAGACLNSLS